MAYVIPPEYLPVIQSVSYNKGVPASWLAAVCELTGWNPNYKVLNYDRIPYSVRRFGIAGIWASINEIVFDKDPSQMRSECLLLVSGPLPAGWLPVWYMGQGGYCACPGASLEYDVMGNLNVAATILKNCGDTVKRICGGYNELIFLRWQLGCNYVPQKNAEGNCIIPPGLPDLFKTEMQKLVEAQVIYADQFAEQPIVAPPPPPISVSLSANALEAPPGSALTFTANAAGGVPPYHFHWSFGDTTSADTTSPVVAHAFEAVGVYGVIVTCYDAAGDMANSPALDITISEEAPPVPTSKAVLWGLLGLAGLVGVVALGKKGNKREQARKLRQQASALRSQAAQLRASGKHQQAAAVEQKATELDNKASQLEAEATREEQEKARREAEKYRRAR